MIIDRGLHHKSGVIRKATYGVLQIPRSFRGWFETSESRAANPPVLVNSVPKSGTHLLDQIATALPNRRNYGTFLSSMTSSFQFKERSEDSTLKVIRGFLSGELVRGHLFYAPAYESALDEQRVVHFFIYRDPRDVVLSEAHYLRSINRWHKLHQYFRKLSSTEAIELAIKGFNASENKPNFPDISRRYARYSPWIVSSNVQPVRFEDLVGPNRMDVLQQLANFYLKRSEHQLDRKELAEKMSESIDPERSHTFRKGKGGGWRKSFTAEHRRLFHSIAGNLLFELGYEMDDRWVASDPQQLLS